MVMTDGQNGWGRGKRGYRARGRVARNAENGNREGFAQFRAIRMAHNPQNRCESDGRGAWWAEWSNEGGAWLSSEGRVAIRRREC